MCFYLVVQMKDKIKSEEVRADRRCIRSESEARMQPDA